MFEPLKSNMCVNINSQISKSQCTKNFLIKMSKISLKLSLNGCVEACGCSQGNCVTDTKDSSAPAESVRNVREWRVLPQLTFALFWVSVSGVFMRGVNVFNVE